MRRLRHMTNAREGGRLVETAANCAMEESIEQSDLGFTYRKRKGGEVEILHRGRRASTLRGRDAEEFMFEVEAYGVVEAQQLMARVTGNYKHGNERQAASHPRNRR